MAYTLHVVSHTHWDREWYLTFQQFRMRLVDLIDHLLELLDRDENFRSFHLDAQTIVLEDYLQIRPYQRALLEQYIREGRIIVGPWYQLNDEFLTSGEATVRSLLVGTRIARRFGACASIGYLPDQFGNISQMPQILRGFGIDNAVFGRGYQLRGGRKMEFLWQSPDGSQVTASLMAFWYNNAQRLPVEPGAALRYIEDLLEKMAPVSASRHLLLMNGVDHLEAQQDLSPILVELNRRLPEGTRIVHSTVEQYVNALKEDLRASGAALETVTGELREDRGGSCLAGTLSSRIYLKQANHRAQITLERYAEPLSAFAVQAGAPYPQDFLHYAWKLLMQNHPHDSICGCSIDAVHREMMPRFAQVEQIGEDLSQRALNTVARQVELPQATTAGGRDTGLVVFNPLNWTRTDPVQATLVFPLGEAARGNPLRDDSLQVGGLAIYDAIGNEVPFEVTAAEVKTRVVLSPVELPLDQWVQEISIVFIAQGVPACGYAAYQVSPRETAPQYAPWTDPVETGWQPVYEDRGDVGDEYLYRRPAADERLLLPALDGLVSHESSAVRQTTLYTATWELPAGAVDDLSARMPERTTCTVTTRVTRWRGCPRIEFTTTFDNRARDHRLRVVFRKMDAAFSARPYSITEGQFDVLTRPLVHPQENEDASPFHPQQGWTALEGTVAESGSLLTAAVLNQGLPEVEIYTDSVSPEIAVTLLRSVDILSRRDDGPEFATPEAQCLGEHTFRYALYEAQGGWLESKPWKQAHQYNAPLRAVQVDAGQGENAPRLPAAASFVTVEPEELVVTAIKRAEEDENRLIVRFFNITGAPVSGARAAVRGADSWQPVNLNEDPVGTPRAGDTAALELVRPKEIVTLAFGIKNLR